MKKAIVVGIFFVCLLFSFPCSSLMAKAESEVEEKLKEQTHSQIEGIDFSDIEESLHSIENPDIIGNYSAVELVNNIVDGNIEISFESLLSSFFVNIKKVLINLIPLVGVMLGIVLLSSVINKTKPSGAASGISEIVFFSTYTVLFLIVSVLITMRISETASAIGKMREQIGVVFPVLLTLMTASGASTSVKLYNPMVAVLSGGIASVFSYVLLPMISVLFVISVVSNLSDDVKLTKFQEFISSSFKWIIGFVSTIFIGFLAVKGISSATRDGLSIRTARYAIKNYVPVIGGYISEGFELVMISSILIKNGVGIMAILMLISTVLSPIVSIIILSLLLKLVAAVAEPISDKKFCCFLSSAGKTLSLLCVVLIGFSLMYFLSIALIIGTANNIV